MIKTGFPSGHRIIPTGLCCCVSSVYTYSPFQSVATMKLVQFLLKNDKTPRVGIHNEGILDLTAAMGVKSALDFIQVHKTFQETAAKLSLEAEPKIPLKDVELLAPITNPDKLLCIGMNYKDHCEEQNKPIPTEPLVFNKFPSCIVGPNDDIPYPEITKELDWEVELAIVIGKKGFNIPLAQAPDHIFGFTVAHDVSARDWQLKKNGGQWLLGKAMDAFCPLGPCIVTTEDISDPHNLHLTCKVNGDTKQDSSTKQLVFNTNEIVAWCSQFCTLLPGDVILTGTPPGVGCFMKPPQFLKKGDVVECYIENIGTITNKIV